MVLYILSIPFAEPDSPSWTIVVSLVVLHSRLLNPCLEHMNTKTKSIPVIMKNKKEAVNMLEGRTTIWKRPYNTFRQLLKEKKTANILSRDGNRSQVLSGRELLPLGARDSAYVRRERERDTIKFKRGTRSRGNTVIWTPFFSLFFFSLPVVGVFMKSIFFIAHTADCYIYGERLDGCVSVECAVASFMDPSGSPHRHSMI